MKMLGLSRGAIAVGVTTLVVGVTALMPGSFGTALAQTGDPGSGGGSPIVIGGSTTPSETGATLTGVSTNPVSETSSTTVTTTSGSGSTTVTVPPSALPEGAKVQVGTITNQSALELVAPPPRGADIVVGVQINAVASNGSAVTGNFDAPVSISFEVPAASVPQGASTTELVVAFWNGSSWTEVTGTVTPNGSGGYTVNASVTHFTTFAVLYQPGRGTFLGATPVFSASGFAFAVFGGGNADALEAAATKQGASGVWVQNARGEFQLLVVAGPAFLRSQFTAQFPNGVPASSSVTLTKIAR